MANARIQAQQHALQDIGGNRRRLRDDDHRLAKLVIDDPAGEAPRDAERALEITNYGFGVVLKRGRFQSPDVAPLHCRRRLDGNDRDAVERHQDQPALLCIRGEEQITELAGLRVRRVYQIGGRSGCNGSLGRMRLLHL